MDWEPDFYFRLRGQHRARILSRQAASNSDVVMVDGLRDGSPPPERWLQQVWRHQRLRRHALRLGDGSALRVLHPGFWNREPGPDFRGAVIQFGEEPPRTGDVELDLAISGWRNHGHAANRDFAQVILHVVWDETDMDRARPPVMALQPFLDAPVPELATWLDLEACTALPDNVPGKCSEPLRQLLPEAVTEILRQAASLRRERKATEFAARARQVGWQEALWEGLLAALGYKHNAWAFRRLAELVPFHSGREPTVVDVSNDPPIKVEAHLLGLAGLLPTEMTRVADPHVRALWDCWWRERDALADQILPQSLWHFGGIRPANRPERRLALAARWHGRRDLPGLIEAWLEGASDRSANETLHQLLNLLLPPGLEPAPYWDHHWTFRSREMPTPQPLMGAPRITDLAVNVILPWLWARTGAGLPRPELRSAVEYCWGHWPSGEDNAVLRLARQRLFGSQIPRLPARAFIQQGLLQIVRDFCDHSGALCEHCRFPDRVNAEK